MNKYICLVFMSFMLIPLPAMSNLNLTDASGTLKVSAGYYDNTYLLDMARNAKESLDGSTFINGDVMKIDSSRVIMGVSLDLALFWDYIGLGFSSGAFGFLNYYYIPYDNSDGENSYARIEITSYVFPQNINVYWRRPLTSMLTLVISGGPGYYLSYNFLRTAYKGIGSSDSAHKAARDTFRYLKRKINLEHDFGIQLSAGMAVKLTESFSFDFGVNAHILVGVSPLKMLAVGYVGVSEKFEI